MGLADTLSLVFLWVCLFHFGYQQEIRLSHSEKRLKLSWSASLDVPAFYSYSPGNEIFKADLKLIATELYYRQKVATSVLNNILKVPKNPIGGTCQISLPKWLEFTRGSPTIKNLKLAVFSAKSYTTYGKSIMRRNRKICLSNKLHPKLF